MSASARFAGALVLCLLPCLASAQLFEDPDWKESEAPPPPAYQMSRLVPVEMPAYSRLKVGLDPQTVRITGDGIVRYVAVASSDSGAINAFYEGVRCSTLELKVYARSSGGAWEAVEAPEWMRLRDSSARYAREIAKAVCMGRAPRQSVRDIVQELREPVRY